MGGLKENLTVVEKIYHYKRENYTKQKKKGNQNLKFASSVDNIQFRISRQL